MQDEPQETQTKRKLSVVLLRVTLLLTLSLGTFAALMQMWIDLRQEKEAVQASAEEFLVSIVPSAASAVYDFYDEAAERVIEGLFTQRAITGVTIFNDGKVMVTNSRTVASTLPNIGGITGTDEVVIERLLLSPTGTSQREVIGRIEVTVDRSVVAPAIVNRMFAYFLLAAAKNCILGICLIAIVYGALARHIVGLAAAVKGWSPKNPTVTLPPTPRLVSGTEIELLGERIKELARTASAEIRDIEASRREVQRSNNELSQRSETLSLAMEARAEELQKVNDRLLQLTECDDLTGLRNRRAFDRRALTYCAQVQDEDLRVSVLMIDVDHFKAYNDFYGHPAGDEALSSVARILERLARAWGAIVARYGGEEFVALFSSAFEGKDEELAAAIQGALAREQIEHKRSTTDKLLTVSIGIADAPSTDLNDAPDLDKLTSAADEALYEAKRGGRNRTVRSTDEIRHRLRTQRLAARALLEAIEEERFEPFFQPQIDAVTGRLIGAEALARWRGKDGKIITPGGFMSAAEESGLLPQVDRIILKKVQQTASEAIRRGLRIPRLSVNAPRDGLYDPDFVAGIVELSSSTKAKVSVELLETALIDTPDDVFLWQISQLRDADVEIEIDDFGTGHTSIVSLMSLKPNRLKIAKELVIPIMEDQKQERLLKCVIDIGRTLEVGVLAEGVETAEVSEQLIALGCAHQQGYHFARPMSAPDFLDLLEDQFPTGRSQASA